MSTKAWNLTLIKVTSIQRSRQEAIIDSMLPLRATDMATKDGDRLPLLTTVIIIRDGERFIQLLSLLKRL